MDELVASLSVTSVARAESLVVQLLKFCGALTLYGFAQLGNLSLEDRIENTRDFDPIFLGVQGFRSLHCFLQLIKLVVRQFPI